MFSAKIRLGFAVCFLFTFLNLLLRRKTLMENHTVYFICLKMGRMFCWLIHHVWKIKCCQNLHWTHFLMKSRLNYVKPQGALVTVKKSVYSFYYTSRLECPYLPRILLLCLLASFIQHATLSYKIRGGRGGWGFFNVFLGFLCGKLIWNPFRQYFIFLSTYIKASAGIPYIFWKTCTWKEQIVTSWKTAEGW